MANATRQVQWKLRSKSDELLPEVLAALEKEITAQMEAEGYPVFLRPDPEARRHYPGEAEAFDILVKIRTWSEFSPNSKRLEAVLKLIRDLTSCEEAFKRGNARAIAKATRTSQALCAKLQRTILAGRIFAIHARHDGLVIQPGTDEGTTAFALLSLFLQRRLSRIRKCLHCREWFFARFEHQRFCPFPTECQWNHYHTAAWRRKQRGWNAL